MAEPYRSQGLRPERFVPRLFSSV